MATARVAIRLTRQEGRNLFLGSAPKVRRPKARRPASYPDLVVTRGLNSFRIENLPVPPSVNGAYVNVAGVGRVASQSHKAWKQAAGLMINAQRISSVLGKYKVRIDVSEGLRGDIDNRCKLAGDLLVSLELTPDDRFCAEIIVRRDENVASVLCNIEVTGEAR